MENLQQIEQHMLALKVMRLTRPALKNYTSANFSEPSDLTFETGTDGKNLPNQSENLLANENCLLLPQSFGNIYLGETFSSYICVHNNTDHSLSSVSVKCDLQSQNNRISIPIHANKTIPAEITKDSTLDDIIHYEVKEAGTHILVCEVS
jgi:hypothetical protein